MRLFQKKSTPEVTQLKIESSPKSIRADAAYSMDMSLRRNAIVAVSGTGTSTPYCCTAAAFHHFSFYLGPDELVQARAEGPCLPVYG